MHRLMISLAAVVAVSTLGLSGSATAHHSFAMFDLSQHKLVEGRVTDWNYNNPHSWLHIDGLDENGEMQTWSLEGAAPVHATRQGVDGNTFKRGEFIRVVMSPLRDGRNAGAMCFVQKEDDSFARPNDGTCDAVAVIELWQSSGWLENGEHLDTHPTGER